MSGNYNSYRRRGRGQPRGDSQNRGGNQRGRGGRGGPPTLGGTSGNTQDDQAFTSGNQGGWKQQEESSYQGQYGHSGGGNVWNNGSHGGYDSQNRGGSNQRGPRDTSRGRAGNAGFNASSRNVSQDPENGGYGSNHYGGQPTPGGNTWFQGPASGHYQHGPAQTRPAGRGNSPASYTGQQATQHSTAWSGGGSAPRSGGFTPNSLEESSLRDQLDNGKFDKPCIWCGDPAHELVNCFRFPPTYPTALATAIIRSMPTNRARDLFLCFGKPHGASRFPPASRGGHVNPHGDFARPHDGGSAQRNNQGGQTAGDARSGPSNTMRLTLTAFNPDIRPDCPAQSESNALYYPEESDFNNDTLRPIGSGIAWDVPSELQSRVEHRQRVKDIDDPKHPLRTTFAPLPTGGTQILTNHFDYEATIDHLWEYEIKGTSVIRKDRMMRIYAKAIEEWPFLRDNKDNFVTNHFDRLVSWINLDEQIGHPHSSSDDEQRLTWDLDLTQGEKTMKLKLIRHRKYNMQDILGHAKSSCDHEKEKFDDAAKCMNMIVARSFDTKNIYQQSANKFFVKKARSGLTFRKDNYQLPDKMSHTLEIIRGYYYTIKPGMGNLILNFSLATSAFFRPILVSEFLADTLTFPSSEKRVDALIGRQVYLISERKRLDGEDYARLNSEGARIKKVAGLGKTIETLSFRKIKRGEDNKFMRNEDGTYVREDGFTKVTDHLMDTFVNFDAVQGQPAVNVGNDKDPVWYAQEQLRIIPYQVYRRTVPDDLTESMVNQAAKKPVHGRAFIENEGLAALGFTADEIGSGTAANLGVSPSPIRLTPTMLKLPCNVLNLPIPTFRGATQNTLPVSRWKIPHNARFYQTKITRMKYQFIVEVGVKDHVMEKYRTDLGSELAKRCGDHVKFVELAAALRTVVSNRDNISMAISKAKSDGADLVVFLLKEKNRDPYPIVKDLSDRFYAIQSICLLVKPRLITTGTDSPEVAKKKTTNWQVYITNVAMKINLKLGGVTQSVSEVRDYLKTNRVMVLGADVVHAGPGAYDGTPSIAAMAGSVDFSAGKCLGSMRLQPVDKKDRETITSVADMVRERLIDWAAERRAESTATTRRLELPQNIIYYRDGVGSGQYNTIKTVEVEAIRTAYAKLATEYGLATTVNIHAVVVVKRHHTRFYPTDEGDKFGQGNTLPGTFVDRLVTSPYYQDFYLQSHIGLKGTAKPTHYFVIEDGIPGLTLEKLRDLTHAICHSYARALCAVSYASPTYYADRLCDRGRMYIRDYLDGQSKPGLKGEIKELKERLDTSRKAEREQHYWIDDNMTDEQKTDRNKGKKQQAREDAKAIENDLRDHVFEKVKEDFYKFERNGWMNPWSRDLADTMFWM